MGNRRLDALVNERVMGITWDESRCRICGWPFADSGIGGCTKDSCSMRPRPKFRADSVCNYSTDLATAWQVVNHLITRFEKEHGAKKVDFALCRDWGFWAAHFHCYRSDSWAHYAVSAEVGGQDSAEMALIIVALRVVGVTDDEIEVAWGKQYENA